jgi:hypothetical protein
MIADGAIADSAIADGAIADWDRRKLPHTAPTVGTA